jgi:hypothetical protein
MNFEGWLMLADPLVLGTARARVVKNNVVGSTLFKILDAWGLFHVGAILLAIKPVCGKHKFDRKQIPFGMDFDLNF